MVLKLKLDGLDPRAMMGASLTVAAIVLTPLAAVNLPARVPTSGAIAAVVVLGLVCTAAAFVVAAVLIRDAGTSRALVITYVNPVIAVALGVVLLGEQLGAGAVAGLLLILAGSWLSTGGRLPPLAGLRPGVGRGRGLRGAGRAGASERGRGGRAEPGGGRTPTARMDRV
jgi:drug/metabolite transporter (DMT)-like permease